MILLPIDIKLSSGIALMGNTKVIRQRNGSLKIMAYKCSCRIKGRGAVYLWDILKCLADPSVKKGFDKWLSEYHANVKVISRASIKGDMNYEEFLAALSTSFHIFIP